jgi:hypothetical protein
MKYFIIAIVYTAMLVGAYKTGFHDGVQATARALATALTEEKI